MMGMSAPPPPGPEMDDMSDGEKEDQKQEGALRDAMYALGQVQQLQIIKAPYNQDPKFRGIIGQIHTALDSIGADEAPPRAEEAEPEEESVVPSGPMDEMGARSRVDSLFGRKA